MEQDGEALCARRSLAALQLCDGSTDDAGELVRPSASQERVDCVDLIGGQEVSPGLRHRVRSCAFPVNLMPRSLNHSAPPPSPFRFFEIR